MEEEITNKEERIINPRIVHDLAVQIQDQILDITNNISKLQYDVDRSVLNQEAVNALTAINNRLYAPSRDSGKTILDEGSDLTIFTSQATK